MRYLKLFEMYETFGGQYNVGDYILIDVSKVKTDIDDFERVFGSNNEYISAYICQYVPSQKYCYGVRGYNYDDSTESNIYRSQTSVSEDEIIRKLTPEEIEEFEAKKASVKYNL